MAEGVQAVQQREHLATTTPGDRDRCIFPASGAPGILYGSAGPENVRVANENLDLIHARNA